MISRFQTCEGGEFQSEFTEIGQIHVFFLIKEDEFRAEVFFLMLGVFIQEIEDKFTQDSFDLVCKMKPLLILPASDK